MLDSYVQRGDRIAARVIAGEAVVITLSDGRVHFLNETGSTLWAQVDGRQRVRDLVDALHAEFDVTSDEATNDVLAFVRELEAKGIVRLSATAPSTTG